MKSVFCAERNLLLPTQKDHTKRSYCYNTHYKKCEVCGKEFPILASYIKQKCCSPECANILGKKNREKKCMEKYGVTNAGWTDSSQQKIKKSCIERYGKSYFFQTVWGNQCATE